MNVWMALIVVPVLLLVVKVLELRRRVAHLEKGRDMERGGPWAPRPGKVKDSAGEPPPGRGGPGGRFEAAEPAGPRRRPGTEDDGS